MLFCVAEIQSSANDPAFPPTRWSLVVDFRDGDEQSREDALSELCQAYWYPVYAFVRRSGKAAEDAKDLTQGFFLDFLERETFSKANPECGRMRTFILTALKRYLAKVHAYDTAQKRGSGQIPVSIDESDAEGRYLNEASDSTTPELLFERRWADALFQRALSKLQLHFEKSGRADVFLALSEFLAGESPDQTYADAAEVLGQSENTVAVTIYRMRKRFRNFLEEEIRQTLATGDDFEDELTNLHVIFQNR